MDIRSFRARTLHEALQLVRAELGPDAAVIETKHVRPSWRRAFLGRRQVEVTASCDVTVASRFGRAESTDTISTTAVSPRNGETTDEFAAGNVPAVHETSLRDQFREGLASLNPAIGLSSVDSTYDTPRRSAHHLPEAVFRVFAELVDAEVPESVAREMIANVRGLHGENDISDGGLLRQRLLRFVEDELNICGPIRVTPGSRRVVALVGPTGVGKTTTIAKLAANFRLRDRHKVGLITVDTYRIAAVEQLRTYADIIDLPMEVVSTPREMREAVCRLSHLDLILMDTAGRSPRDELKLQELKTMLSEAAADEVHLVLSATAGAQALSKTARHFADVGTTALILTKLDETTGLGNLLPLLRGCDLPMSYVTNGQNVPNDIQSADREKLAAGMLNMDGVLR
jgi:flagellar biosynthesis protein FlhF